MENRDFEPSGERTAMKDLDVLRGDVEQVLNLTRAYVEQTGEMEWSLDRGNCRTHLAIFEARLRSILLKQFESLEVISELVGKNKGSVAGPLLRPACEEFIWVKYLAGIRLNDAENILRLVGLEEICDSLTAIDETAGSSVTEELGLTPSLEKCREFKDKRHDALREIAKELGWPDRGKRILPSVHWLAKKVEEEDVYGIVYHATSRFVHFSAFELSRRVWWSKSEKKLLISSAHFSYHWNMFSLHWGALLFIYTMREIVGFPIIRQEDRIAGRDGIDFSSVEDIGRRIEGRGTPPIVDPRELAWPEKQAD